jgi:tetratricopeptide (TPR) repeat protein
MSHDLEQQADFEQGQAALFDDDGDAARACLQRMLDRNADDPRTIELGGDIAYSVGEFAKADACYQRLTAVSKDPTVVGISLLSRGLLYEEQGELEHAKQMYQQASEVYQQLGDNDRYLKCLGHLAEVTMTRGEWDESEDALQKARAMLLGTADPAADDDEVLGLIAQQLGTIAHERDEREQAEKWFQEAVDRFRGGDDPLELASSLDSLGAMKQLKGDYDEAEPLHQEAVAINESIECLDGLASNFWNLAHLYEQRGELERADEYREKASQIDDSEDYELEEGEEDEFEDELEEGQS